MESPLDCPFELSLEHCVRLNIPFQRVTLSISRWCRHLILTNQDGGKSGSHATVTLKDNAFPTSARRALPKAKQPKNVTQYFLRYMLYGQPQTPVAQSLSTLADIYFGCLLCTATLNKHNCTTLPASRQHSLFGTIGRWWTRRT
jgi:hypothetical protein